MDEQRYLQDLIKTLTDRIRVLELQKAGFGLHVPANIETDLNNAKAELAQAQARLAELQGGTAARIPDNLPNATFFVGRSEEIERCLNALDPEERGWGGGDRWDGWHGQDQPGARSGSAGAPGGHV